jgi:epoxyqueuosine reductase
MEAEMPARQLADEVKCLAREAGFQLAGLARAEPLDGELEHLREWLGEGHHGTMDYMAKRPEARANAQAALSEARTILMLGMNYFQGEKTETPPGAGYGRLARYARGADYHDVIGERLEQLAERLHEWGKARGLEPLVSRPFVDAQPLLERGYAERAGLGFFAKNSCLIHPEHGSWFFIAGLALSWELTPDAPITGTCGRCTRCLDACPTDAFPRPGIVDARRCISYLTIEMRDEIASVELERGLGDWLFGCDVCQDVCPYNKAPEPTSEPAFQGEAFLDLRQLATLSDNRLFNQQFKGSPVQRGRRRGLQRTAAHLVANEVEGLLSKIQSGEVSPAVARNALNRLQEVAKELVARAENEAENPGLADQITRSLDRFDAARHQLDALLTA